VTSVPHRLEEDRHVSYSDVVSIAVL